MIVSVGNAVWSADDPELLEQFVALARERNSLTADAGRLVLGDDGQSRPVAATMRAALAMILARRLTSRAEVETMQRLRELNEVLHPALRSHRRLRATFPSRRQHTVLEHFGVDALAVSRLIGLDYRQAEEEARRLGLRLSTADGLLHRAPSQLDVVEDGGLITNLLGLHVD